MYLGLRFKFGILNVKIGFSVAEFGIFLSIQWKSRILCTDL